MITKTSSLIPPSYTCLQTLSCSPQSSTSCTRTRHLRRQQRPTIPRRTYAQHYDASQQGPHEEHEWPKPVPPSLTPTPYQILAQSRHKNYCKQTFHHLVKLYHPDRTKHLPPSHPCSSLPPHILLERYRLIVAAHTLLSDDAKRSAYDRFGAGWIGASTAGAADNAEKSAWYYNFERGGMSREKPKWRPGHDPMCNATWEDWEKWHDRNNPDREPQNPLYASNTTFLTFLFAFAAMGVVVTSLRAGGVQESLVEQRDRRHMEAHVNARRAREAGLATGGREESIKHWLRLRDERTWEVEAYRRLLPRQETCESESVAEGRKG